MFSKPVSVAAVLLSTLSLVQAQTFTKCDPTKKTCPADPALGKSITTDFTKGESSDWHALEGTTMDYNGGANFIIAKNTQAPTMQLNKYIFFGKVEVVMKASSGAGVVSSFILESDDLDEIDWEWLGTFPNEVQSNFFGKGDTSSYDRGAFHKGLDNTIENYLKYTIDWTDKSVQWKIGPADGTDAEQVLVRQLFYTDPLAKSGTRYPQTPMKVKMGSWIACLDMNDPAKKGTCDWAGGEYSQAGAPYTMNVKTVTVTDYGCGGDGEYTYSDLTGSWESIRPAGYCAGPYKNSNAASSSSKPTTSSAKPTTSTSSTKSGAVFAETSTTTSATSTSASSGTTAATPTTFSVTNSGTLAASQTSGSSTSSATSAPSDISTGAASKPKHRMGALEYGVIGLGLGLGYFVM
ncbi:concanavalin A-like lectin/glucanase domain-containing protein [Bisporella sp. PMI_857]|nr:concanavalin A-like lectin/glucanase domain-containing protein [Bisporella sp. PMI_857]